MSASYQRVVAALTCREPDRVPVLLLMPLHGAEQLGLPLPRYLRDPAAVAEGQARLLERYRHDCVYGFAYAAAEAEAFGAEVEIYDDGSPNVARPPLRETAHISALEPPSPTECAALARTLEIIRLLADRYRGRVPILANAVGPLSLPVMLLGMERWLDLLLLGDAGLRDHLLAVCEAFCARWAQAQLDAGADALAYFEPMASREITTAEQFRRLALPALSRVARQVRGPLIFATAGARTAAIADEVIEAGAAGLVASAADDLAALKRQLAGKAALAGSLNNIAMTGWDAAEAQRQVRRCIAAAAGGGGYLLCDQHGEIPLGTPPEVLTAVVEAAQRWGVYPVGGEESAP